MWKRTCTCSVIQNNTLYSSSSGKSTKNSAHYRGDAFKVLHKIMTLASVTVAVRVCHCVIGLLLWDTSQWMSPLFALAVLFFVFEKGIGPKKAEQWSCGQHIHNTQRTNCTVYSLLMILISCIVRVSGTPVQHTHTGQGFLRNAVLSPKQGFAGDMIIITFKLVDVHLLSKCNSTNQHMVHSRRDKIFTRARARAHGRRTRSIVSTIFVNQ